MGIQAAWIGNAEIFDAVGSAARESGWVLHETRENLSFRTIRALACCHPKDRPCRLRILGVLQYRRRYPDELLDKSNSRGRGDYQMDYEPAPRITEADKRNDLKLLQRALDKRLYLLLYVKAFGAPSGKPVWHFPEKVHDSEKTLRKCAESALASVIGDLSRTYFVGNAPMGHMVIQPTEHESNSSSYKRFFFKSQVVATNKFDIGECEDFVWVTKDELLEYFPEQAEFLNKMIIS